MKKIIKRIIVLTLAVLLIVIVAGGITVYSVWFNKMGLFMKWMSKAVITLKIS